MNILFFYLLLLFNSVNLLHLGFYMVMANIYDIMKYRSAKTRAALLKKKYRPLVSVVVPAHNEAVVIERTLDSIRASTYKRLEIIVIDDGSTDRTASVVRKYIQRSPLLKVQTYMARNARSSRLRRRFVRADLDRVRVVLVSQANAGKASAMNNAIQNYVRGSLVMCIDADSVLAPTAIARAVTYFDDPAIIGVGANVRVMDGGSLLGLLQRFEHMIGYRSKKFYTVTNSEFIIGGVASTYRTRVLRKAGYYDTDTQTEDIGLSIKLVAKNGNRKYRIIYASDVVAMTEGVQTFGALMRQRYRWKMGSLQNLFKYRALIANTQSTKYSRTLTFYRLPIALYGEIMLLLEPLILGYVLYLSFAYHSPWIFLGAYFTITLYVLMTLWPDEHMNLQQKLKMSVQAVLVYVLFFAMDVVQVQAIIKCLINYKKVLRRTTAQTWISPARKGQPAQI